MRLFGKAQECWPHSSASSTTILVDASMPTRRTLKTRSLHLRNDERALAGTAFGHWLSAGQTLSCAKECGLGAIRGLAWSRAAFSGPINTFALGPSNRVSWLPGIITVFIPPRMTLSHP